MKVAVYYSNTDIRIEDQPTPSISGNEILVEMQASGICGTDVMEWYRIKKSPRILGHEMAGVIVAAGKNIDKFKTGDRVFVSHHVPCYECYYCRQHKYTACESLHAGNYYPGGFAEFIRIPDQNIKHGTFILPEDLSFEDASMIEPLGCVIAGQKQLELKEGQTVLIIGSGVSGILHIQLAKSKRTKIIATDINEYRINQAMEFGADRVINAKQYSVDMLKKINNDRLSDVVIVCAAVQQAIDHALSSVDRKGKILFFAAPEKDITIPSLKAWREEISFFFSYGASPDDLRQSIELIENGTVNVHKMITHRVRLSDIMQGFQLVSEAQNSLKVVIVPDGIM